MHVRVGLPQQYMFTAMNLLREDIIRVARAALGQQCGPTIDAVLRITDIELAIMLGTYIESRGEAQVAGLRELIVTHLPMTVVVLDREGRISSVSGTNNPALLGSNLIGRPWREAIHPALIDAADLGTQLERSRESGSEIVLPRVDAPVGHGEHVYRVTVARLEHALAETMIHFEDLTDAVASEARAKRAEHLARLGTLAGSVAHEIRNPLAGISGAVQVVQSSLAPDDKRAVALQRVQEQIARLGTLVGDLLSFSKPVQVNVREVDLLLVAQAAASGERGAVVEGAGRAKADSSLLTQVILNLVQNAAQAGAGEVRVMVQGSQLRVMDDGPGVPEDIRERIFEPFFTTKTRGTGLGLPIARKMVEGMGGSLTLCKSRDRGACFEVTLPPAE